MVKDLVNRRSRCLKTAWLAFIERGNLENAAAIHVTSRLEADDALQFGYRLPRFVSIPNGVDALDCEKGKVTSEKETVKREKGKVKSVMQSDTTFHLSPCTFHEKESFHPSPFTFHHTYLLFLGRLNWKKGLDRLIPALTHLPEHIHLVLAGNDEENYQPVLEALADKHGVRSRVIFTGLVRGADKTVLLQNAAVLVLPSYSENFGNVVLEAMAVGCPVAVTPEVGAADIVREYGAGLVIGGDRPILGEGLRAMLENTDELALMGQRGRKAVEEHFSWDAVAREMAAVYGQIVTTHRG